jgi:hypothetical protein
VLPLVIQMRRELTSVLKTRCRGAVRSKPKTGTTFQAFTPNLHELAAWLKRCGGLRIIEAITRLWDESWQQGRDGC